MAASREFSRTCSLSYYFGNKCGFYAKFQHEIDLGELKNCRRAVQLHLRECKLTEELDEGELVARRAGVFGDIYHTLTVCLFHRYTYGLQWKPGKVCSHPEHPKNSKAKAQHGIDSVFSFEILKDKGVLLPVGAGQPAKEFHFKQEEIDDDDLVAALTAIDEQDLMSSLMV